jgi:hypothetical protein
LLWTARLKAVKEPAWTATFCVSPCQHDSETKPWIR